MPRDADGLTPRQAKFVGEYLVDLNATQAAIRAGYSHRTANEQAARLLTKENMRAAVAAAQKERAQRLQIDADKVLRDLEEARKAAFGAGQYGSAIRASELQGKHLAMFVDRQAHEGGERPIDIIEVQSSINFDAMTAEERATWLHRLRAHSEALAQAEDDDNGGENGGRQDAPGCGEADSDRAAQVQGEPAVQASEPAVRPQERVKPSGVPFLLRPKTQVIRRVGAAFRGARARRTQ